MDKEESSHKENSLSSKSATSETSSESETNEESEANETPSKRKTNENVQVHQLPVKDDNKEVHPSSDDEEPLVTQKELWGWYLYDAANSPYLNSVVAAFLPVFMTLLAYNNMNSDGRVVVWGISMQPSSVFSYATAVAVILQVLSYIFLGALADFGKTRKKMFVGWSLVGSISVIFMCFIPTGKLFWISGILLVTSTVGMGISVIYYNSFLPLIVKNHPLVRSKELKEESARIALSKEVDHKISTYGFISGYMASVFLLILNIATFALMPESCNQRCRLCPNSDTDICPEDCNEPYTEVGCDSNYFSYRVVLTGCGLWWLALSLFTYAYVPNRGSKPFPPKYHIATLGVKQMGSTLKELKKLPNTFKFLAAYWFYSDGFASIQTGAALVAVDELGFEGLQLGIAVLQGVLLAGLGSYLYLKLYSQTKLRRKNGERYFTTKTVLLINVLIVVLVPIYVRIPGSVTTAWEFYLLAAVYGLQNGSCLSFSRVLLARLTPKGQEAEFYSFFEFTDKGTSWAGPLIIGIMNDATRDIRWAVMTPLFFLLMGAAILCFVNEDKGIQEVKNYEEGKPTDLELVTLEDLEV